jgi:hypothetical protein
VSLLVPNRRNVITLAVVDFMLFVVANVTAKNKSHPGTVSDITWYLFLIGALTLIVLGVTTLVQSRRRRAG